MLFLIIISDAFYLLQNYKHFCTKVPVSIYSSCYNKIPQGGIGYKEQKFIVIVLKAGKFKMKVPADLVSGEGTFLIYVWYLLAVSSNSGKGK
jgi:hypothetical protein